MDAHKVTTNKNVLTLSFEKAATAETKLYHPWRYFIAGGETLQKIESLIADFATVNQAYDDLAREVGAKSYDGTEFVFDFNEADMTALTGKELVDFNAEGGRGGPPWQAKRVPAIPDFVVTDGRSYGGFFPDLSTPRGKEINDKRVALKERAQPLRRFARWLECSNVQIFSDLRYTGDKQAAAASAYKIGEQWIVAVPVSVAFESYRGMQPAESITEEWKIPPGSTPLSVSQYFALLEKSGIVTNTPAP